MSAEVKELLLDLKQEMKSGFERVDKRFEEVDQRLEGVDQRFEQIDQHFEQIDQRLDRHEGMLEQLIHIVGLTNQKLDEMRIEHTERLDHLQKQIDTLAAQQTDIEYAHERITHNERSIAKIKKVLLG